MTLELMLGWLLPDVEDARETAEALRRDYPHRTPEEHARLAVAQARKLAVTAGATTGLFASPITLVPAAAADAVALLKIEGRMVGTVAALMDPAVLTNPKAFKGDLLGIVFPGVASQALRALGVRGAKEFTRDLIRRNVGKSVVEEGMKWSAKYLGVALTRKALITKAVPLVGAGIGGGWNWLEVQAVGNRAIAYYQDKAIGGDGTRPKRSVVSRVRGALRMLPVVGDSLGPADAPAKATGDDPTDPAATASADAPVVDSPA